MVNEDKEIKKEEKIFDLLESLYLYAKKSWGKCIHKLSMDRDKNLNRDTRIVISGQKDSSSNVRVDFKSYANVG